MIIPITNRNICTDYFEDTVVCNDNLSRILTFQMKRYYDGIDLSSKTIKVKYLNAQLEDGESVMTNIQATNKILRFDWTLDDNFAKYPGRVYFQIEISDTNKFLWQTKVSSLCVERKLDPLDLPNTPKCNLG